MDSQRLELDLHRLELRFAASRLVEPRAVARIAHSIERCGQVVPCIVVAVPSAGGERLVLIDGYRRVAALRRFEHYQKAFRSARDHMVNRPRLFIDALRETGEQRAGERLRDGPEGECAADLRSVEVVVARLRKRVAALRPLPLTLIAAVPRLRAGIDALINEIQGEGAHDSDRDP